MAKRAPGSVALTKKAITTYKKETETVINAYKQWAFCLFGLFSSSFKNILDLLGISWPVTNRQSCIWESKWLIF